MTIFYSPSNKGFYNNSFNYPLLPSDLIEVSSSDHIRLLSEINSNNKVIVVEGGEIKLQEKPAITPPPPTWDSVRHKRNSLLQESDYTQLSDYPNDNKAQWAIYRQALRDIPQTNTDTSQIIWPTKPA